MKNSKHEGTDANVYFYLIGADYETEKFWLNRSSQVSSNRNLFESGNIDEFELTTKIDIEKPRKCRIGHDNSGAAAGWHLERVEAVNKRTGALYVFMCNRWLSDKEDDGKTERILYMDLKRNSRLEIVVKHEETETEAIPAESNLCFVCLFF